MGRKVSCVVNGIKFDSKKEACRHFNVKYNSVHKVMGREKVSFEVAVNILSTKNIEYNGVIYPSVADFCRKNKMSESDYNRLQYWRNKGLSVEDAFFKAMN